MCAETARRYSDSIIFTETGTLLGEPEWAVRDAEAAGVIFHCAVEDGSCGVKHSACGGESTFWHFCEGKTDVDYDAVTGLAHTDLGESPAGRGARPLSA